MTNDIEKYFLTILIEDKYSKDTKIFCEDYEVNPDILVHELQMLMKNIVEYYPYSEYDSHIKIRKTKGMERPSHKNYIT